MFLVGYNGIQPAHNRQYEWGHQDFITKNNKRKEPTNLKSLRS